MLMVQPTTQYSIHTERMVIILTSTPWVWQSCVPTMLTTCTYQRNTVSILSTP